MPPDMELLSTLIGSNNPHLKLIFMVPKVFKSLKFYCIKFQVYVLVYLKLIELCTRSRSCFNFCSKPLQFCCPSTYSLDPIRLILSPISCRTPLGRGMKVFQIVFVTWPRWMHCPYVVKTLKKLFFSWTKDLWLWNFVCIIGDLTHTKFEWWPCTDLELIYGKINFGILCLYVLFKSKIWYSIDMVN